MQEMVIGMEKNSSLDNLADMIADLKEEQALAALMRLLVEGMAPDVLLEGCMDGMRRVGKRFEEGRYYIAALIMAGEIMRRAAEILGPHISADGTGKSKGTVLLGTVQGDIHDLGKNLFADQLRFDGVEVVDLGIDVSPDTFLTEARKRKPDMVGLSCVLTSCISGLKDTIQVLRSNLGDQRPPIIIGGACVDEKVREFSKADFCAQDSTLGLRIFQEVLRNGFKVPPDER
jgi:methanogenic corrinoid protein MtbC1